MQILYIGGVRGENLVSRFSMLFPKFFWNNNSEEEFTYF
jgi:hypothetical protein